MLAAASAYLQNHPELVEDWRLDVIAIQRFKDGRPPEIIHFENVITEY
jgi:Holliday junction resolvase-like predicted endonuclease